MNSPELEPETPRWRRLGVSALFALGWLTAGVWLLRDRIQPRLVLVDQRLDIGKVPAGGSSEVRFRIENRGLAPLQIRSVTGSCGCLTPQFPPTVPPFGKAEIRTRFEPLPDWNGPMDKVLTIRTSDPIFREVKAHLIAQVEGLIRKEPEQFAPVAYRYGETQRRTMRLTPRPGSGVRLTAAATTVPFMKARLVPPTANDSGGAYELQVDVGPCKMAGDFNLPVRLTTTDPAVPAMNLMISGMAVSGPVISPLRIFEPTFRAGNPGDEMVQARVFTRSGRIEVKSAKTTIPEIGVRIRVDQPGREYMLTLFQNTVLKSGPYEGELWVTTDDPRHPKISIPISITIP